MGSQHWLQFITGRYRWLSIVGWGGSLAGIDDGSLHVVWTTRTAGKTVSSVAVANGIAYAGSDDHSLYAVVAKTGRQLWSAATSGPVYSSPAVAANVAYVGSNDGGVYAFDANTGTQFWKWRTGGPVEPPVNCGWITVRRFRGRILVRLQSAAG